MSHGRLLVLAVLVYVTLDLSLPEMPGAFVFEPADSAESTQVRARSAGEIVTLALARDPGSAMLRPLLEGVARPVVRPVERRVRPVVGRSSQAQNDPAPPSEDPH